MQKKCIFCHFYRFFAKKSLSLHDFSRFMQRTPEEIELLRLRSRLTKRFHKACADYGLIADGDHILVGVSGGKDSLALVEFLGKRAQVYVPRFQVTAVYVRLKERSYQSDIDYLERHCASVRVPLILRDTKIGAEEKKDPCFLCSWYRRKALFDVAQELGCNKIALGHHKDDIIETLLMNLIFQGSIGTIPPLLQMEKMPIQMIRPLCLLEEHDTARYAELSGYEKQLKACPFEKESSRTQMKQLLKQLEQFNPNVRDSIWSAMENIKAEYLPKRL
jgi:tRNA(Ile)-lysidine synthase TilS/MesJ